MHLTMVRSHLRKLFHYSRMVCRQTTQLGQRFCSLLIRQTIESYKGYQGADLIMFVLLDEKTWSLREEEQSDANDKRPGKLHSDRDAV